MDAPTIDALQRYAEDRVFHDFVELLEMCRTTWGMSVDDCAAAFRVIAERDYARGRKDIQLSRPEANSTTGR